MTNAYLWFAYPAFVVLAVIGAPCSHRNVFGFAEGKCSRARNGNRFLPLEFANGADTRDGSVCCGSNDWHGRTRTVLRSFERQLYLCDEDARLAKNDTRHPSRQSRSGL